LRDEVTSNRADVISSFTIIKGALIPETYAAFRQWNPSQPTEENLRRLKQTNPIGARSTNWLRDVVFALQRRFDPTGRDRALVSLARAGCDIEIWKPIMLWHMTRDEFLVRDFLINWLFPLHLSQVHRIRAADVVPYLESLSVREVRGGKGWTKSTILHVAAGLLKIVADFGLLKGRAIREFTAYHLREESFLYLIHAMQDQEESAARVVDSQDWRMFLMSRADVERELYRLHQFRRLHFDAAGSLIQLQLPCSSAAEFAERMVA
jgi:hypothetical protein